MATGDYQRRLDRLECHFKWLASITCLPAVIDRRIDHLHTEQSIEPYMKQPCLALSSYLYTLNSPKRSTKKALECVEEGLTTDSTQNPVPFNLACEYVLKANKLHILHKQRKKHPELLRELEEKWKDLKNNPEMEASIWGTRGIAMLRMDNININSYKECLDDFEKAICLDQCNPHWYYWKAHLMGRVRRNYKGITERPDEEEIECLGKAKDLTTKSERENHEVPVIPVYTAMYASVLSERSCNEKGLVKQEKAHLRKLCQSIIQRVRPHAGVNHAVYRLCAKTYQRIGKPMDQKECLVVGVRNCEQKALLQHAIGRFYWKNFRDKDLKKAEEFLTACVEYRGEQNVYADLDLINVKKEINSEYDAREDLMALETKYTEPVNQIEIYKEFGKYFMNIGMVDNAIEEFVKAVELERNEYCEKVSLVRDDIESLLDKKLAGNSCSIDDLTNIATYYQHVKPVTCNNLEKSKEIYHKILAMESISDVENVATRKSLAEVLMSNILHKWDEAIEALQGMLHNEETRKLYTKCLLKLGGEDNLRICAHIGCLDAAPGLLYLYQNAIEKTDVLVFAEELYSSCAKLYILVDDEQSFYLDPPTNIPKDKDNIKKEIKDLLLAKEIRIPIRKLRLERLEMSISVQSSVPCDEKKRKISNVLCTSKYILDGLHQEIGNVHFNYAEENIRPPVIYFPIVEVNTDADTFETIEKKLLNKISSKKGQHGRYLSFSETMHHKFKPLLKYLARENFTQYAQLMKPWFDYVNKTKHESDVNLCSKVERKGTETEEVYELAKLAHKAAEFSEKMAIEYQKYTGTSVQQ